MAGSFAGTSSRDPQSGALIRLRGVYPSLKTALQKVADLILRQPEMAIYASVNEVAAAAQVSEATVMRLCRTLGFKGFQDFKIALARELVTPSQKMAEEAGDEGDPATLVRQIFKANIAALEETREILNLRQLQQAVQILLNCRRLMVAGVGGSGPVVQYAGLRLTPLGLEVRGFTEVYQMLTYAALLTREDVLLAISHSGSSGETLDTARVAKGQGARVIGITNNPLAPLTRISDLVLITSGRELPVPRDGLASLLCQITIIDCLFALLQRTRPDETRENLDKIQKALRGPG
jgi:RpiR family carbohydrate utilization transcriptional regulator